MSVCFLHPDEHLPFLLFGAKGSPEAPVRLPIISFITPSCPEDGDLVGGKLTSLSIPSLDFILIAW